MTIVEAIKKAMDGGYRTKSEWRKENPFLLAHTEKILLDPNFWKCLFGETKITKGKQRACSKCGYHCYDFENLKEFYLYCPKCGGEIKDKEIELRETGYWLRRWHSFIDHLAEGKTPEDYFNTLK